MRDTTGTVVRCDGGWNDPANMHQLCSALDAVETGLGRSALFGETHSYIKGYVRGRKESSKIRRLFFIAC